MSEPLVLRVDHGPVAVLTLNRPKKRNALSRDLISELGDTLSRIETDTTIRAVVLTGVDPVFCAGMDLQEASESGTGSEAERLAVSDVQSLADLIDQVHKLPLATIAAVNGDALAGGAGLATACDFVIAAEQARFGYPEVRRGLVPAVIMHELVRQVGDRHARTLLLTGEPIAASEAERWGLVTRVVTTSSCLHEAIALGHAVVASAPKALVTTKRLLDEATGRPLSLRGAAAVTAAVRVSEEAGEGMRAFLEKRPAAWAVAPREHSA